MDSIADMGGVLGYGPAARPTPGEPPFAQAWEGRAFALTLLAMGRISGRNLDAFRYALGRLHPLDYLADGYYGRWLNAAELMLVDSGVLAAGAVDDYAPSAPGSLREIDDAPRFAVSDPVRTADAHPRGPSKLPAYLRRRRGTVTAIRPAHVLPDTHGVFAGENPQYVYTVGFASSELWGPDAEPFRLHADLFESYLETETDP
jgi:hypothetical protein